ncbi:ADP-glyceromanno-heptose 6-epimerase [Haliovirga abyssi]|uniref:ADP-L-glycero-D-manno-heptose-6-epimerase n=1 Tax=Haliovirga abyssi TaxID=2996794 RepID=A0AAU9DUX1_9FUSO|nr:ADP-glyceromanno-heptose 6-epimerase [Haliovirga abyssi]BDU49846.1 ADP-L-glycero-D-manno-heptose-6-epimerase [Haliovirga abyssi]
MILVTGAAGFIGSSIVWELNNMGRDDIIVSDKFHKKDKWKNLIKRKFYDWVDREELFEWLEKNGKKIDIIIHMGANSATTEKDVDFLMKNNYEYTKRLFNFSLENGVRFIYASSAATYGGGENGYNDDEDKISKLQPLNPYGFSKQLFDLWELKQEDKPKQWVGLKFFNVYGPNEYHKDRMASVVYHAYNQAKENGVVKLFKSHKENYKNGEQLRDFVYIKDVTKVIKFFIENENYSGIYNLGTGQARSFYDLAKNTMNSMGIVENIKFIDMPVDIRDKYQYFTEANMDKLKSIGYKEEFYSLEKGIKDYVKNYLMNEDRYL